MGFVNLHNHTDASLPDGFMTPEVLAETALGLGQTAVAITDHGVCHNNFAFYKVCQEKGIKPILGSEPYITLTEEPTKEKDKYGKLSHHLVLLAMNQKGLENIQFMVSEAFKKENRYYKPRIPLKMLRNYTEGVYGLSACLGGPLSSCLLNRAVEDAVFWAKEFKEMFQGRFALELQDSGVESQDIINKALIEISKHLDMPLVCTSDAHYPAQKDHVLHNLVLGIRTGAVGMSDENWSFTADQAYMKSEEEMRAKFPANAVDFTNEIADMCNVEIKTGITYFPVLDIEEAPETELRKVTTKELEALNLGSEYKDRLAYELEVINKLGFAGYFLLLSDIVKWCKANDIMTGPGRGSASGSMVAYLTGITKVDPLKYDLLFERFLHADRIGWPDY